MATPFHRLVLKVLAEHDPMGICADNPDADSEYAEEAKLICARLSELAARSVAEVTVVCHSVFFEMFGELAGPAEDYRLIAGALLASF